MLVTTGRNPGREGRAVARAISLCFPGSILEGRGRRALASLLSRARKLHFSRLCTVYRGQGRPCSISFISLCSGPEWERLAPEVRIKASAHPRSRGKFPRPPAFPSRAQRPQRSARFLARRPANREMSIARK